MDNSDCNTLIVGAGGAGLAVGACLKRAGVPFLILEAANDVAATWRRHYDRLHLHTDKSHSALPYLSYPDDYPRYPSRDQVVRYLETYAKHFELTPSFGQSVTSSVRCTDGWETQSSHGTYHSKNLVYCTGYAREPVIPRWPGQQTFSGSIVHSSDYRNGRSYLDRRVLVVGFGNSGGEIAIDLSECGAHAAISVRSPVNVIPRELFGIPILALAGISTWMPARVSDRVNGVLLNRLYGDLEDLGFRRLPYGPLEQVRSYRRVPLIDIGTIDLIRRGKIAVRPGVDRFDSDDIIFTDGTRDRYDAVILATGYRPNLGEFLPDVNGVLIDGDRPIASGSETAPGLYFCGLYVAPGGMLQEIGKESRRIASDIASRQARGDGQ